jgi:type II secretory ATPase GspE/PulE/Tfp pilus assembly ATPase PilB-like protein
MGLEPYRITSSLYGVVAQRLLRRISNPPVESNHLGRIPIAEFVGMTEQLRAAILARADAEQLQQIASKHEHHTSLRDSANSLVAQRLVDTNEVQRVLGPESP